MNTVNNTLCCGCLCSGRRMIQLKTQRLKQFFFQIIDEFTGQLEELPPISLCWECHTQVDRFTRFKEQIRSSYILFREYIKQQKPVPNLQTRSKLSSHKLYNIDTTNSDKTEILDTYIDIIKIENDGQISPEPIVTEDFDNTYIDTNSDDEKLIDISRRNAKAKKKKAKRKEIAVYKEIEMSAEDLKEERRLAKLEEDYVNAMFRCERCIISFPNAEDLSDHVKMKHELNASQYKCSVCECSFVSEVSYNYHTNKHTRRYQCVICNDRFNSKKAAIKHFEYTHCNGMSIEFDKYNMKSENGRIMNETEDLNANSGNQPATNYPCDFCDKIFRWKTSLRKHLERHRIETGEKRKPYCESCRLSFTTTSNLQKHVKASSKHQIQLKLRKLKEALPDSSNPEKHQARVDQIRSAVNNSRQKYCCPQCDKKFQWRGNLLRHVNSHLARAKGELVCKPCNRTFSSIATYKQHMKISKKHVSENDFKYMCSDCGKRFANKTRLKDHVNWEHLKNYVHTCDVCQKVFKSHTSLYLHRQVVHKKDNAEHLCDHCGKPFPNHAKLRTHITAVHSSTSAYKCATCGASFSWHSCLSRHVRKVHANRAKVVT